jgi:UV DNA damage endonuclease
MLRRLGYVAINLTLNDVVNRTCRLANATPERLRELIALNLEALERIIQFNGEHNIRLYRITSEIVPFASHPVNELIWWEEFAEHLAKIGSLIRSHDIRVSMHPGQYTVLNSPRPEVVANAIADLTWHVRFLDALQVDTTCKVNIHVGGIYGDKNSAIDRFVAVASELPIEIRRRLTIENDDRSYTALETLHAATRSGLPVIFDWLHHNAKREDNVNVTEVMHRCFETWTGEDGHPKTHYSSQLVGGRPGAHADFVDPDDFIAFLEAAPDRGFDCMIEAKRKDLALFKLRDDLRRKGIPAG